MKKMKKVLAMLLAAVMVMGMSVTAFAVEYDNSGYSKTQISANTQPSGNDKVDVKIEGIEKEKETDVEETVTVTLYKIAEAEYGEDGRTGFIEYKWAKNVAIADKKMPTAAEITAIANGLVSGEITSLEPAIVEKNVSTDYTKSVEAGAYIAIITESANKYVYNPVLLTATYNVTTDASGNIIGVNLEGGTVNIKDDNYLYGSTSVAKRTEPGIDKVITGGHTTDDKIPEGTMPKNTAGKDVTPTGGSVSNATASVGDVIQYDIRLTIPQYPANAANKTLYVSDEMVTGLTFDISSLEIIIDGDSSKKATPTPDPITADYSEVITFTYEGKAIAKAKKVGNGFNLSFDYNNLVHKTTVADKEQELGAVYVPTVKYSAIVNDSAVVGKDGNTNTAILYYAKNPNEGSTYLPGDLTNPPDANEYETKKDKEAVYTYKVAFHKIGEGTDKDGLEDAVFGIYSDSACTKLVDKVVTNSEGYAVSTKVKAGTYYIKEIEAPQGYTLNETVYEVKANWETATVKTSEEEVKRTYYTKDEVESNAFGKEKQVGWLDKEGKFYSMNETNNSLAQTKGWYKAYLKSETSTSQTTLEISTNEGSGTSVLTKVEDGKTVIENISNTRLVGLPSTGGIGTTIFTIGGCAIMVIAAGLFFATRRKAEK